MKDWMSRKVRFVKATTEQEGDRTKASVELTRPDTGSFVGRAERPSVGSDILRAGAQAAAEAVRQASGRDDAEVTVQEVEKVKVFGAEVVIVMVAAKIRGEVRSLYGVCHVQDDAAEAAALAVLNATNRVYDLA
jgi:hypothetical protein